MLRRNRNLDFIKGMAIVLMVVGHALVDWPQSDFYRGLIYLFHMPVFFIASGYFFNGEKVAELHGFGRFFKSRVVRLWWPYVFWVTVFILLNNLLLKCNYYTDNEAIRDLVPGMSAPHATMTIKETVIALLFTLPMVYRPEPTVALWFLKSLMVISVGYALVEKFVRRFFSGALVVQTVVAILMLVLLRYHPRGRFETLMFYLGGGGTFYGWFLFHVGRTLHESGISDKRMSFWCYGIIFVFALSSLLMMQHFIGCWNGRFTGGEWFYLPSLVICSMSGWVLLLSLSKLVMAHVVGWGGHAAVEYIGRHTMPILILHLIAFKLVNYVGVLIKGDPLFVVAGFPTSYHGWIWTVIYTIVGIVIPLAVEFAWRRLKGVINKFRGM